MSTHNYNREYYLKNRDHILEKQREWKAKNRDKTRISQKLAWDKNGTKYLRGARDYKIRVRYGINRQQYEEMMKSADYKCQICGSEVISPKKAKLDHDHSTGKLRGILCAKCNMGLGLFGDSLDLLRSAVDYLYKNQ